MGRIRPGRQGWDKATMHIFDTGYDPSNEQQDELDLQYMSLAKLIPTGEEDNAREMIHKLFHIRGYRDIINGSECFRQALFRACGIPSEDCGHCSICRGNNDILRAQEEARAAIAEATNGRNYVIRKLIEMKSRCLVCRDSACFGTECLKEREHEGACLKCHQSPFRGNFHRDVGMCCTRMRKPIGVHAHIVFSFSAHQSSPVPRFQQKRTPTAMQRNAC